MSMEKSGSGELKLNRRKLIKAAGISAASLGASLVLPSDWTKPIARFGVLPAHAQVSGPTYAPISSTPSFATGVESDNPLNTVDSVNIYFDGANSLTMVVQENPDSSDPDFIINVDVDSDEGETWDVDSGPGGGSNWSVISASWTGTSDPTSTNIAEGTGFTIRVQRIAGTNTGRIYDITFDVAVAPSGDGFQATVSNVQALRIS
jgi:hypothetical protein